MIHSMNECLVKLKAINNMAIQGVVNSKGIEEKTRLTFEFLKIKIEEYNILEKEIISLRKDAKKLKSLNK